jgi:hypothetical protein
MMLMSIKVHMDIEFKSGFCDLIRRRRVVIPLWAALCHVSKPDIGFHCDILLHGSVSLVEETHDERWAT